MYLSSQPFKNNVILLSSFFITISVGLLSSLLQAQSITCEEKKPINTSLPLVPAPENGVYELVDIGFNFSLPQEVLCVGPIDWKLGSRIEITSSEGSNPIIKYLDRNVPDMPTCLNTDYWSEFRRLDYKALIDLANLNLDYKYKKGVFVEGEFFQTDSSSGEVSIKETWEYSSNASCDKEKACFKKLTEYRLTMPNWPTDEVISLEELEKKEYKGFSTPPDGRCHSNYILRFKKL